MQATDVFTVRDLRQRTGELIRTAAAGRVSIITSHGRPALLTVPFDGRLLECGVHQAMALRLFEQKVVTLSQAAKLARLSLEDFFGVLRDAGVEAVDYPPEELEEEMESAL